jgi:hypothetical protein
MSRLSFNGFASLGGNFICKFIANGSQTLGQLEPAGSKKSILAR